MQREPYNFGPTVTGLLNKLKVIQVITNNVSNANTIGFKREVPESLSFGSILNEVAMKDKSQGPLKKTGNVFDLAIEGNAYFLVEGKEGIMPTRNGNLHINEKGNLATSEGDELIVIEKTDKEVILSKTSDIEINKKGEIIVDGERYGRIAMQISDNKPVNLHQGYVENSNVDLMFEMTILSVAYRSFESSEKALGMEMSIEKELIDKYGRNV